MPREIKVGALIVLALAVLSLGVFLVGEKSHLFTRKNHYFVQFETVGGLAAGSPVQLSGVTVGEVQSVVLPRGIEEAMLTVWMSVDRSYAERIREDSQVRIKTLGLLGDKFIEITSGSPTSPIIPADGKIPAAAVTDVDRLLVSGGDAVDNVVAISYSLRSILTRMEAGEGILGELTVDSEAGREAKESIVAALGSFRNLAQKIEAGEGLLAMLVNDEGLAAEVKDAAIRLVKVIDSLETAEGVLPLLVNDPATRERFEQIVDNLDTSMGDLAELSARLTDSQGLVAKLMSDEAYAEQVGGDLQELMRNLNLLSGRLEQGEGTLGALINDEEVYEAINDILVGIDESKFLRWLVRSRQKAGIEERYEEEKALMEAEAETASPPTG